MFKQYKSSIYDEANTRVDFIDKFFELLDWDVRNNQGFSENYREVIREDKIQIEGKQKAPDYSFRIGGSRKFFVEAKKPSVNVKEELDPAFQVRRYGYTAKLPLSILTDFEEFAIYDTRIKPDKNDKSSVARIFYCNYEEYEKHFEFIYNTFSKNAILKGSFDKYIEENKNKKGTSEVDKELLKLVEDWRTELAKNIALRNNDIDIYNLNNAVQKIIDRIIFLRIAEDKEIEPYEQLLNICRDAINRVTTSIYERLNDIFIKANNKYNAGLFLPDDWLSNIKIDDKVLSSIIQGLYYPECPYEFSILPIEILGNIYEQFLGKTIRFKNVKDGHTAVIEEKPKVRKAGGVYYTPQYIVNYIVENTIGVMLRQDQHPEEITKIKICDPACGSGSFLVGAYSFLLNYHLDYYTKEKNLKKALKIYQIPPVGTRLIASLQEGFKLTIEEKQKVLINNIYGVDIDPQAVEVTKLSLYLKLLENESIESKDYLFSHTDIKLLPSLDKNIKCGNSLIGSDFYKEKDLSLFGNDEMRKVNVFDWDKEFPEIFLRESDVGTRLIASQQNGFDVVIGNPPYVFGGNYGIEEIEKEYYKKIYFSGTGKTNLFTLLLEKSLNIINHYGLVSFIIPNTILRVTSYKEIRKYILSNFCIRKINDLGVDIFEGATTSSIIILIEKKPINNNMIEIYHNLNNLSLKIPQDDLLKEGYIISTNINTTGSNIISKFEDNFINLGELCEELIFGVVISNNKDKVVSNIQEEGYKPFLEGKDIKRYYINPIKKYLLYKHNLLHRARTPKIFEAKKKLLIQRITGGKQPLKVSYDNQQIYNKESINNLILKDDCLYNIKFILGVLNSSLINWFYNIKFTNGSTLTVNISKEYLSQIPIKNINFSNPSEKQSHDRLVSLVNQMLETQKQFHEAKSDNDKKMYKQKIDIIDKQIDELVYKLYGLTDEEIKIIEGV